MFSQCYVFLALLAVLQRAVALDEREYDAAVAPPPPPPRPLASLRPLQLWRSFTAQLGLHTRHVLTRLQLIAPQPQAAAVVAVKTKAHATTTTAPALQYYGALNPIFQQDTPVGF